MNRYILWTHNYMEVFAVIKIKPLPYNQNIARVIGEDNKVIIRLGMSFIYLENLCTRLS